MGNWQRARFTVISLVGFALAWMAWTLLLPALAAVDELWRVPPPPAQHWLGQIGSALGVVSTPVVVSLVVLALAFWASRRQLTALAATLVLATALTFGIGELARVMVGRDRPGSPWDFLFSQQGPSYPSMHVATITMAAVCVTILVTVSRRGGTAVLAARTIGPVVVAVVALERLLMGAAFITDVVGGVLLGGATTALAGLICGVHIPRQWADPALGEGRRAAIIFNPTKVIDQTIFTDLVQRRLEELGWEPPIWLSTTATDPGRGMARAALDAEADLIMVAGGDGTVRVVCGELAGTGVTVAIVPSGTGNLLAGNLGIPSDVDRALDVAFEGRTGKIDVLKVSVPGKDDEHAVVMCGVGADAAIIGDTDEDLKRQIGVGAYVVAGLNHIKARPVRTTIAVDDEEPFERNSSLTMVCNVSDLQAGLTIAPAASANDGILDVIVASPANQTELTQLISAVLTGTGSPESLTRRTGRRVRIDLETEQPYQLDGDIEGHTDTLGFEVLPGALVLRLPR